MRIQAILCIGAALTLLLPGNAQAATYSNPFTYCEAVGTIDAPDGRYVGPKLPLSIAKGLQKAFGVTGPESLAAFVRNSHWRCMNGSVYACSVGANLPCLEKADLATTPAPPLITYCQENPTAEVIPAYVTGRATVYLWRCSAGTPQIVRQVAKPDARGFLMNIWYRIEPASEGA